MNEEPNLLLVVVIGLFVIFLSVVCSALWGAGGCCCF
jgi:hypothetical protein